MGCWVVVLSKELDTAEGRKTLLSRYLGKCSKFPYYLKIGDTAVKTPAYTLHIIWRVFLSRTAK